MKTEKALKLMFRKYPDVVTVTQMCEMLVNISTRTGYELLRSGKIRSFQIGRNYRIPKIYILEYMES